MKKMTRILLFFAILFTVVSIMPVISKAANQGYSMNITYSGDVMDFGQHINYFLDYILYSL